MRILDDRNTDICQYPRMRPTPTREQEATIASRLRWLRDLKQAELKDLGGDGTQNDVARFLEVDPGNFSNYCRDKKEPSAAELHKMSLAFGVDFEWLFSGSGAGGRVWRDDPTYREVIEQVKGRKVQSSPAPPSSKARTASQIPGPPLLPGQSPPRHLHPVGGRKRPTK